jgi:hypothetical protein
MKPQNPPLRQPSPEVIEIAARLLAAKAKAQAQQPPAQQNKG